MSESRSLRSTPGRSRPRTVFHWSVKGVPVRVSGKRVVQRGFDELSDGALRVRRVAPHSPHELVIQI